MTLKQYKIPRNRVPVNILQMTKLKQATGHVGCHIMPRAWAYQAAEIIFGDYFGNIVDRCQLGVL